MAQTPTIDPKPYKKKNENVAKIVRGLTRQDSPLMKQARTDGIQQAATRGLTNSSMAVGAAQGEAIRAATPIAQQMASQRAAANLSNQNFGQEQVLQATDLAFQKDQAGKDRALTRGQSVKDRELTVQESALDRDLTSNLAKKDRQSARALQKSSQKNQNKLAQADRQTTKKIAKWNMTANEQKGVDSAIQNYNSLYQNTIANINGNREMDNEARQGAIDAAEALLKKQIAATEKLYAVQIEW